MKKLLLIFMLALPTVLWAWPHDYGITKVDKEVYFEKIDGIYYRLNKQDWTAIVTLAGYRECHWQDDITYSTEIFWEFDDGVYSGDVVIPEKIEFDERTYTVTEIDHLAFSKCEIESLTIPKTIKTISNGAFDDCKRLKELRINDWASYCNMEFGSRTLGPTDYYFNIVNPLELAETLIVEGKEVNQERIVVAEGVTTLKNTFSSCIKIKEIILPNSVTDIKTDAFQDSYGLRLISLGTGVKRWGKPLELWTPWPSNPGSFDFSALTIDIRDLQQWLGMNNDTSGIYSYFPPLSRGIKLTLNGAELGELVIPEGIELIPQNAFCNQKGITSVTLPESLTEINGNAFRNCIGLTSINIPVGRLNYIYSGAFSGCEALTELTIPDGVELSFGGFADCKALKSVIIGDAVKEIFGSAFQGCSALKSVLIGRNVSAIGDFAFANTPLRTIISKIETPFHLTDGVFSRDSEHDAILYVPKGTMDAYSNYYGWQWFKHIVEMDDDFFESAVDTPQQDGAVRVAVHDGGVTLRGGQAGETCSVYTLDGRLVARTSLAAGETSLSLPKSQIYMLKTNGHSQKIWVK